MKYWSILRTGEKALLLEFLPNSESHSIRFNYNHSSTSVMSPWPRRTSHGVKKSGIFSCFLHKGILFPFGTRRDRFLVSVDEQTGYTVAYIFSFILHSIVSLSLSRVRAREQNMMILFAKLVAHQCDIKVKLCLSWYLFFSSGTSGKVRTYLYIRIEIE